MTSVELLRPNEISASQRSVWAEIQEQCAEFHSPYFRPEFMEAVASIRDDVFIAVLEEHGETVGFFPFQRDSRGVGFPIGCGMCDCHGVVVRPEVRWDPGLLIRQCGLTEWRFHALIAQQTQFGPFAESWASSPFIDVSQEFETYAERQQDRAPQLGTLARKLRKLDREVGPVRFEAHCADAAKLHDLLRWRSERYEDDERSIGLFGQWWVKMLDGILQTSTAGFSGMCSLLWAGDRVVAAHMGLRSYRVLHWWFPSYDEAYASHSPGALLLVELIKNSASLGIDRIDFGAGGQHYTRRFMTGAKELQRGAVVVSRPRLAIRKVTRQTRAWLRETPLRPLWHAVRAIFV